MIDDRFADRYKIKSSKLNNWDYSTPGKYFITICAYKKNNFFGKIENNKIRLKEIGLVAKSNWLEITRHFDNVKLDEFIIMPNHMHGIIEILPTIKMPCRDAENRCRDVTCNVSTIMSKISPKKGSIPVIIRSYKGSVQKYANDNKIFFGWQPRYFDEVIFDDKRYLKIKNYIKNNPDNWVKDKLFNDNRTNGTAM